MAALAPVTAVLVGGSIQMKDLSARNTCFEKALDWGIRFADFVYQINKLQSEAKPRVHAQLFSAQMQASFRKIELVGTEDALNMTITYLAVDANLIEKQFLTDFEIHSMHQKPGFRSATKTGKYDLLLFPLTNIGKYNFVPPEFYQGLREVFSGKIPEISARSFYAYEIIEQSPFKQVCLSCVHSSEELLRLPKVNFIIHVTTHKIKLVLGEFNKKGLDRFLGTSQLELANRVQLIQESPQEIATLVERMFRQFVVPEEAQRVIRGCLPPMQTLPG